jgi:hypothetical protein
VRRPRSACSRRRGGRAQANGSSFFEADIDLARQNPPRSRLFSLRELPLWAGRVFWRGVAASPRLSQARPYSSARRA